jgi:putative two-component system response regulator
VVKTMAEMHGGSLPVATDGKRVAIPTLLRKGNAHQSRLPDDLLERLELAAPLHDTGKIGIPEAILKAPRELTAEERRIMQQHVEIGFGILSKSNSKLSVMAAEIAHHHHEKWDGSGYPDGLAGDALPEAARIVALADVLKP